MGKRWTATEDRLIAERYPRLGADGVKALMPWRPRRSIMRRASDLGVRIDKDVICRMNQRPSKKKPAPVTCVDAAALLAYYRRWT